MNITLNTIEKMVLIEAREKPNILKFISLQLGRLLFKDLIISVLSIRSILAFEHPENSLKILFSMPT